MVGLLSPTSRVSRMAKASRACPHSLIPRVGRRLAVSGGLRRRYWGLGVVDRTSRLSAIGRGVGTARGGGVAGTDVAVHGPGRPGRGDGRWCGSASSQERQRADSQAAPNGEARLRPRAPGARTPRQAPASAASAQGSPAPRAQTLPASDPSTPSGNGPRARCRHAERPDPHPLVTPPARARSPDGCRSTQTRCRPGTRRPRSHPAPPTAPPQADSPACRRSRAGPLAWTKPRWWHPSRSSPPSAAPAPAGPPLPPMTPAPGRADPDPPPEPQTARRPEAATPARRNTTESPAPSAPQADWTCPGFVAGSSLPAMESLLLLACGASPDGQKRGEGAAQRLDVSRPEVPGSTSNWLHPARFGECAHFVAVANRGKGSVSTTSAARRQVIDIISVSSGRAASRCNRRRGPRPRPK